MWKLKRRCLVLMMRNTKATQGPLFFWTPRKRHKISLFQACPSILHSTQSSTIALLLMKQWVCGGSGTAGNVAVAKLGSWVRRRFLGGQHTQQLSWCPHENFAISHSSLSQDGTYKLSFSFSVAARTPEVDPSALPSKAGVTNP